ncbi:MAG: hypothetical protein AB7F88_17060 [Pyrinomonadaceae bacterium]
MFERLKEDAGRSLSEFTDNDHSRRSYVLTICVGLAINVVSWVVGFFTPDAVAEWAGLAIDLSGKVQTYLLAVPFWSTFFAAYALLRLRRYRNPTATIADSDVFARYRDAERSGYLRNRILLAVALGALNVVALVCSIVWFR